MKPTTIREEKDAIFVESPILALKSDTNRIIYAQKRYAQETSWNKINEFPRELRKSSHKRVFLYQLHQTLQTQILSDPSLNAQETSQVKEQKESDDDADSDNEEPKSDS